MGLWVFLWSFEQLKGWKGLFGLRISLSRLGGHRVGITEADLLRLDPADISRARPVLAADISRARPVLAADISRARPVLAESV